MEVCLWGCGCNWGVWCGVGGWCGWVGGSVAFISVQAASIGVACCLFTATSLLLGGLRCSMMTVPVLDGDAWQWGTPGVNFGGDAEADVEWDRVVDWEKLPAVVLRQYVEALLKVVGKRQAALRMDIVRRVYEAGPGDSHGPPENAGRLWPDDCTRYLTGGKVVNPWASLKDAAGCQWGMCEFLRRLHRRGAITDADFPEWAQEAEVVEVRDRKRPRWVLQHPVSGAEVVKPQGGLARGVQGILEVLGGPCEPGPAPKPQRRVPAAKPRRRVPAAKPRRRVHAAVPTPPTPQPSQDEVLEAFGREVAAGVEVRLWGCGCNGGRCCLVGCVVG